PEEQRLRPWIPAQRFDVQAAVVGQVLRGLPQLVHVLDEPRPEIRDDLGVELIVGSDSDPQDRLARGGRLAPFRLPAMSFLALLQAERGGGEDEPAAPGADDLEPLDIVDGSGLKALDLTSQNGAGQRPARIELELE